MKKLIALVAAMLLLPATALGYKSPPRLNEVASWLAGHPVQVRCFNKQESDLDRYIVLGAAAYVEWTTDLLGIKHPKSYTVFSYPLCIPLTDAIKGKAYLHTPDEMAWSILAIIHESGHLRGGSFPSWLSESEVNCWALRRVKPVSQIAFGFSEGQAEMLQWVAAAIYKTQPPEYKKPGCVEGLK